MNIENATDARDLVLTCYICDDQYTGDRIELHIKECENDWNYEEIDKPVNERIPLPKPTREFLKLFEKAKELFQSKIEFYDNESSKEETDNETSEEDEEEEEESEEEPEEISEKENKLESSDKPPKLTHNESDSNIENSLIPCPNCKRTFFADRLTIHLKSCKPGKSMGGTQRKKPAYQPPKLKNKKTWKPPSDHESDEEKINHNKDVEEKGYTNSNKSKRKAPGRLTTYDKFDKEGLPSDTKASQDLSSTKKSMKKPKGQKELTTNTVTTFSRMEEDPEQRNSEFNDIYGAAEEDSRVPCKNCGRKFNPDRLPIHQKSCNNMKKRSVFNSQKKRAADGTMGIPGQKKQQPKKKAKKEQPLGKKAKWKRDHEDLVKAIKMSRMIKKVQDEGGDITKIPVAPPSKNEDYVE